MTSTSQRIAGMSPQKLALLQKALGESQNFRTPIAVVGIGGRFAGAPNIDSYWQVLEQQRTTVTEVPASRWDIDAFYSDQPGTPGKMMTRWGAFLDPIDRFDASFFGISPREAEKMDPQQRILLEVVWEALEYGGVAPSSLQGTKTGVFVGIGGTDYSRVPARWDNYYEQITAYSGTGNAFSVAANRISYLMDLRGPSIAIDTACSSSLVALHLAVRALRQQECETAIVGGVNAILTPETTLAFSQAQMLSQQGRCLPFDHRAGGYVRGEGCGVVILKRLPDATRDGDRVLAVVRGTATNQDGKTSGITAPRGTAQVKVIREALADAGLNPADISYIEAHGTATPLGDPIEVNALAEVFRHPSDGPGKPLYFGSAKGNVGHTETAAGMAGLLKAILMMRHRKIVALADFESLNPGIHLTGSRLQVAREARDWEVPDGQSRFAGVSSFGFGGANAHVVLEEPAAEKPATAEAARPVEVLPLSAATPAQLLELARRYDGRLKTEAAELNDIAYTAATGRSHHAHRAAIVARDRAQAQEAVQALAAEQPHRLLQTGKRRPQGDNQIAFLFPGQGAQFPGMGAALYRSQPVYREAIDRCDEVLADLLPERLTSVLWEDSVDASPIHQTLYTQPALFATQYALAQLWRSWGVEPDVILGHSVGDYAAACLAGVFSMEDGLRLLAHRALLVAGLPAGGQMAVVFARREVVAEVVQAYADRLAIAVHNGIKNVVISGTSEAVAAALEELQQRGIKSRLLEVSQAMHSPLLDPILDPFAERVEEISLRKPSIQLISSHDGRLLDARVTTTEYWRDHLRHMVAYVDAVRTLQGFGLQAAIEVGPGSTLASLTGRMWPEERSVAFLTSLRTQQDPWQTLSDSVATLYTRGTNIDWRAFHQPESRRKVQLPSYPFADERYWYGQPSAEQRRRQRSASAGHPLLGEALSLAGDARLYETVVETQQPALLNDHRVERNVVFPAAGYLEQAVAAAREAFGEGPVQVADFDIQQAMLLAGTQGRIVQTQVGPDHRGERTFEVHSRLDDEASTWTAHASGTLKQAAGEPPEALPFETLRAGLASHVEHESFYDQMAACGLNYGPRFRVIEDLWAGEQECLAKLALSTEATSEAARYTLHPALLDGCLQAMAGVIYDPTAEAPNNDLLLPTHLGHLQVFAATTGPLWAHVRLVKHLPTTDSFAADIDVADDAGRPVAILRNARVQRVAKRTAAVKPEQDFVYELNWLEQPVAPEALWSVDLEVDWLVLSGDAETTRAVAEALRDTKGDVALVESGTGFATSHNGATDRFHRFTIADDSTADLSRVLAGIGEANRPLRVVDLRPLRTPGDDPGIEAGKQCEATMCLLQAFAQAGGRPIARTIVATRAAAAVSSEDVIDPAGAALAGMLRSAMVELPQLQLGVVDVAAAGAVAEAVADVLREASTPGEAFEQQVAYRGTTRSIARLVAAPDALKSAEAEAKCPLPRSERFSLRVGRSSNIEGLHYEPISASELEPHQVEVEVRQTGLNFSDVLKSLGLYPGIQDDVVPLGIECAGVISRVGSEVHDLRVGQRVMGVAPYSFASHAVTADYAVVPTPERLRDDEAATIPITFLTAQHAMVHLARLAEGERILIHAGAGGVGQAAIQIAQRIGAEVFTTAGSPEKREFLRSLGVEHVFDSRSLDFADQILEITEGRGVDVVLNSLPGDAISKSLSILAAYGRFLEIGKIDIYQNRRIGLLPFQDNLSYFAIDLDRMLRQRPSEIRQLYADLLPAFADGTYRPLPFQAFAAEDVVEAFLYMANRKNIGKVVVSMTAAEANAVPAEHPEWLTAPGTTLITGGVGALGRQLARWAAGQGASHLALLTRRAPEGFADLVQELRDLGAEATIVQADVADRRAFQAALAGLPSGYPPVRAVFHAAGVLDDGLIQKMDAGQLRRVLEPKANGAWNLHTLFGDSLDAFVLFSSIAGTVCSPGQANYAAGNAFLDGFARFRRSKGMTAVSIGWGPWDAEGMAADSTVKQQLESRGMRPLVPRTAFDLLERVLKSGAIHINLMDVDWNRMLGQFPGGVPRFLADHQTSGGEANAGRGNRDQALCGALAQSSEADRLAQITRVIAETLAAVVGKDADVIDPEEPLSSLGLDSLMGVELRSKLEIRLGIEIPMASLFEEPTVASLARVAAEAFTETLVGAPTVDAEQNGLVAPPEEPDAVEATWSAQRPIRQRDLIHLGGSERDVPPLFCLHPVGGDLRCYDGFARAVRGRPVLGIRPQGLQPGTQPQATLQALVDDYRRTIQKRCPDGPYHLVGWSTGGIFAYEIARQLQAAGASVPALIMVDTPRPSVLAKVDLNDNAKFLFDLVEFANYFSGANMQVTYEALQRLDKPSALQLVLNLAMEHGVLPAQTSPDAVERLINVCREHVRVLQDYEPPATSFRVHLLRPEDTSILSEASGQDHSDDFGWSDLVALRLHRVPGHHFTMMKDANAIRIASLIESLVGTPPEVDLAASENAT